MYNIEVKPSVVGYGFKSFVYLHDKIVWRSSVTISRDVARTTAERAILDILGGA